MITKFENMVDMEIVSVEEVVKDLIWWLDGDQRVEICNYYLDTDFETSQSQEAHNTIIEDIEMFDMANSWFDNISQWIGNDSYREFIDNFTRLRDIEL